MGPVVRVSRSSVGKKILMAVSGTVLFGYVLLHMLGNLKAFQGPDSFNAYAEFLREVGYPVVPHKGLLWFVRLVLLAAVGAHIWAALDLARASRAARTVGYRKEDSLVFSYASRTMRWGGVVILAFVIYHLLHLTLGPAHPDFRPGEAYHNVVAGFQSPAVTVAYVVATGALALHLYHGIWSVFQTLGMSNPRYDRYRRPLAAVLSVGIFGGFVSVPIGVLIGAIS